MTRSSLAGLGNIMQLAFVPADFDGAIDYWVRTGAGPFYVIENAPLIGALYRGHPPVDVMMDVALGYWGDMQIEIIRQTNDAPSVYSEWRAAGREGLHHHCVQVDDMAAARAVIAAAGAPIVFDARTPSGGEVIYVELKPGEALLEFIYHPPDRLGFYDMLRAAHRDWDGSDPIRKAG